MPSPDNTSIAPAFAKTEVAGDISQSITFAPPPQVPYGEQPGQGDAGAITRTLAVDDELQVYVGGNGYNSSNTANQAVTNVTAANNSYVNFASNSSGAGLRVNVSYAGDSVVKATVHTVPTTNTYRAGDQVTLNGNGANDTDCVLMIPSDFN